MTTTKGRLIVIDGTDGSGKSIQTKLLAERLINDGRQVTLFDFPQYGQKSAGLIENYLTGQYGSADEVGPYRASIFYACDRYDADSAIKQSLAQGKIALTNRYVSSNLAHQGGKIANQTERQAYYDWLLNLEYNIFGLAKPDLNLILHVPADIAQKLVDNKDQRTYLGDKKRDIHEDDLGHLQNAEKIYLELADILPNTKLIECAPDGQLMSIEAIAELVYTQTLF